MSDNKQKIVHRVIEDEMKQSYLDYSMSVIVGRALPDVKDGLKPVHRRILFAMHQMGMFSNKSFKKSARIVGEVLGKFHPHGDTAVYDALVRMTQPFSLRYPLIKGQGNSGSVDGDSAAAMRYTETKMSRLAEEMLQDIDKETVKFIPNFDSSLKEPVFLPAKLPNLLLNGSAGIAVGMATNMPPHNMTEVIDAITAIIDNSNITIPELMQIIKGPDFPTAGIITGINGIKEAYTKGRGKIKVRAKTKIEKDAIIVSEIPYMVNKSLLLEETANLVKDGKISGIRDLRDESDREGMRIVIKLKKEANHEIVLNQLFKHTRMQTTFGINMLALVNNEPKTLNLKELIQYYISHRQMIVRKRTEFDLKKAEQRAHILEGLIVALDNLDKTISIIKKSKSVETARQELLANFELSKEQAQAILDMKLQRLTSLETEKTKKEHAELMELIKELKSILESEEKILGIIKKELKELKEKYGDSRRTEILEQEESVFEMEELIAPEDMVITVTHSGYIKRIPVKMYRQQKRGGKGAVATATKEEDFVEDLFIANTHDYILFFTNKGKVHWLKVYEIPESGKISKGKAIANILKLGTNEKITAHIPIREFRGYLVMATRKGMIKKTSLELFSNPRKGGIAAINLKEDSLVGVVLVKGGENLLIATRKGIAVKFRESDLRTIGRTGSGVRGIRLKREKDYVVGMVIAEDSESLLTVTTKGFGKRTAISEYRLVSRGGSGVKNIKCTEKNGLVVSIKSVNDKDQVMLISKSGIAIRVPVKDISKIGRATQGVRVMKLKETDRLVAAAKIIQE
ncbi:DNA gyrase subunit A [Candidatus Woesearchaeota archaeon]|nr:DNA gyrase subunit A [Candidatus Woesearchaeota archaeon]